MIELNEFKEQIHLLPYCSIFCFFSFFSIIAKKNHRSIENTGSEYAGNEYVRPYFGFPRISRAGPRLYSKLGEGSQETIKRGGPGGSAMWFGPRLGRMQKRSLSKEHI